MNILTNTRKGDAYDMVAINKFPIIYRTNKAPEEFLKDTCMIDQLNKLIKNSATLKHAVLYIRSVDENMSFKDYNYSVKDILKSSSNKEIENGEKNK